MKHVPFLSTQFVSFGPVSEFMRVCAWLLVSLVLMASLCGSSFALVDEPRYKNEKRVTEDRGVPLDTPIEISVKGRNFLVPYGYLGSAFGWLGPSAVGRKLDIPRFSFVFWMPSRRYSEINLMQAGGRENREQGRPPPRPDEFYVRINPLTYDDPVVGPVIGYADKSPNAFLDRTLDDRRRSLQGCNGREAVTYEHGLVKHAFIWPKSKCTAHVVLYGALSDAPYQLVMDCMKPDLTGSFNPICTADVLYPATRLRFKATIPLQDVHRATEIFDIVLDFVRDWSLPN